MALVGRSGYRI